MMLTVVGKTSAPSRSRQSGIVLIVMMIVLVAMTLAAVSLLRSTDTTNVIAGNLSFQQAAVHSADAGIATATKWLADNSTSSTLDSSDVTNGYMAAGLSVGPNLSASPPQSWDDYWNNGLSVPPVLVTSGDAAYNKVSYVIDRLCANAGAATAGAGCASSPSVTVASGSEEEAGLKQLNAPSVVYYRITVRVAGPRNSVSYVQAVVSM